MEEEIQPKVSEWLVARIPEVAHVEVVYELFCPANEVFLLYEPYYVVHTALFFRA